MSGCCHTSVELRPIYRMRLVVITCSAQLILHCVSAKIAPISIKEVNKMRFSLYVGPTSKLLLQMIV